MPRRLHPRFVPPPGRRYHLFDASVLLIGVALLWYITTEPSRITVAALDETILGLIFSPTLWGWSLLVVGVLGAASSYSRRLFDAGYVIVTVALALWTLAILLGSTIALLTGVVSWELGGKALGTALWFGFALRGLVAPLFRNGTVDEAEGGAE